MEEKMKNGSADEISETTEVAVEETTKEPTVDYRELYEKAMRDNANLEKYNRDLKSKYQARLTDEEKQKAEQAEREIYYKNLERELSISRFKAQLSARVTDGKVLEEIASKLSDGDVMDALSLLIDFESKRESTLRQKIEQEMLAKNPQTPPSNGNNGEITKSQFEAMGYEERVKLINENPELYEKLRI